MVLGCKKENTNSIVELAEPVIESETIINNYEIIWGMDFLPNGDLIFGEKRGKLYMKKNNTNEIIEITGLPSIDPSGQGGLLDIKVDPSYQNNGWISFRIEIRSLNAHQCRKLILHDLDHELTRAYCCQYFLPHGLLLHLIGEFLGNLEVDVCIQQCLSDILNGIGNIEV